MSTLHLVRHGQATAGGDDYDRLSPLGEEQGRSLGDTWSAAGLIFDRVFLGPRQRHRQTCAAVATVYRRRGLTWPEPELLEELDEHAGPELFERNRHRLAPEALGSGLVGPPSDSGRLSLRAYLQAYQEGTRLWARGELETPADLESWQDFRSRVAAGLERILASGRGRTVVAFTSGGTVAAAVGQALGLADEKIIELSWRVRNAAVTELLFSPERGAALHTFNTTPHLREARLLTYI